MIRLTAILRVLRLSAFPIRALSIRALPIKALVIRVLAINVLAINVLAISVTANADEPPTVTVTQPYIEFHTGPGRGYPVFHVAAAGDQIKVLKQRTNWFLIQTTDRHPKQGWIHINSMKETAADTNDAGTVYAAFPGYDRRNQKWQWHAAGGDFGGAASISAAITYKVTKNIGLQLEGTQILGDFSDGKMVTASALHYPFPDWWITPYFQLGAGVLQTEPSATLVQAEDRTDNTLLVGGGLSVELGQRFELFMDYRRHTVLTSRDDNEEIDQWKLGINVSL